MSVKELFKSKHLLSDISSFALQNYFCVFFIVWAQIFWHSRISLFPNGQPATKVAWLSSPKAWSQLNSRRKVFYIKKYSLVCISFNFFSVFTPDYIPFCNFEIWYVFANIFPFSFHYLYIPNCKYAVWYVFLNYNSLFSNLKYIPFC